MVIKTCPRCQGRFSFNPYTDSDYVHTCNSGNLTLDQEDVFVIGDYIDEDSGSLVSVFRALMQGEADRFWGTRAWIEGVKIPDSFTDRGASGDTHRQRQHFEFICLGNLSDRSQWSPNVGDRRAV